MRKLLEAINLSETILGSTMTDEEIEKLAEEWIMKFPNPQAMSPDTAQGMIKAFIAGFKAGYEKGYEDGELNEARNAAIERGLRND